MEFTGERYISDLLMAKLSYEHWHRYLFSTEFAKGKKVLDIACGEGYGANLLAQTADEVYGLDISGEAIKFAQAKYGKDNLHFLEGSVEKVPIVDKAFDLIVSFETIEHLDEPAQNQFLAEVRRLIKKSGIFLVSTPNKALYSEGTGYKNEFHKREFNKEEFIGFLKEYFRHVIILGQKVSVGSTIWTDDSTVNPKTLSRYYLNKDEKKFVVDPLPDEALYYLALCSESQLPFDGSSLLIDKSMGLLFENEYYIRDQVEEQKNMEIEALNRKLAESIQEIWRKDQEIQAKDLKLAQKGEQLAKTIGEIGQKDQEIKTMNKEIDLIITSKSWKLTAPLRAIKQLVKRGLQPIKEENNGLQPSHESRGKMAWRFLLLSLGRPFLTLKLMHPRRVKNAVLFLTTNKGNLRQLYKLYQDIYGVGKVSGGTGKEGDPLLADALAAHDKRKGDIFIFPVIDWHFRHQRPQHLALGLGRRGYRVFYFSITPLLDAKIPFKLIESPGKNVFVCKLANTQKIDNIYKEKMGGHVKEAYLKSLLALMERLGIRQSVSLLNHAYWKPLADLIPGTMIGYDCMDHHIGFHENSSEIPESEVELILDADFVVTTSLHLQENVSKFRASTLIRNGCEYDFFVREGESFPRDGRPVAGYIGAIAEWFDIDLIVYAAYRLTGWRFVLIGSTVGCDVERAKKLKNVEFPGEIDYNRIPFYLRGFDLCLVPFCINELTKATNPVKIYEYLCAGKPVVSTALPEAELLGDKVFIARNPAEFVEQMQAAFARKSDPRLVAKWQDWAAGQDWSLRAAKLEEAMLSAQLPVSIIVLTYNNLTFTKACLESIERFTFYPAYEVLLVDNASTDGTRDYLEDIVSSRENWRLIANEKNLGFAAGNNVGIKEARGEFVVLLNNDTYVSPGWLKNLIRPFARHDKLGLTGPVTNNIGNEARIGISYGNMEEMVEKARRYTASKARKLFFTRNIAFFCAAIKREVIEKVGLLDEQFAMGFFEDDDYCRRAGQSGFEIAIVEDSFVHHHLSASFDKMDQERRKNLFNENKKRYEAKWGEWSPHTYR